VDLPALRDLVVVKAHPGVILVLHPGDVVPAVRILTLVRKNRNQLVPGCHTTPHKASSAVTRKSDVSSVALFGSYQRVDRQGRRKKEEEERK
jgi:hypothetical protein